MKIYLAARYSRREEMQSAAADLAQVGHQVTSRWHIGDAHHASEADLLGPAYTVHDGGLPFATRLAEEDIEDLQRAELVISFTEEPRSAPNRGGRHVEFGLALGAGKRCWVVGPRENVFHALAEVFPTWVEALAVAAGWVTRE
jgi:hypothetical protein